MWWPLLLLLNNPQNVYIFLSATAPFPRSLSPCTPYSIWPFPLQYFCFVICWRCYCCCCLHFFRCCLIVVRLFLFLCTAKNFSIDIAVEEVSKVIHVHKYTYTRASQQLLQKVYPTQKQEKSIIAVFVWVETDCKWPFSDPFFSHNLSLSCSISNLLCAFGAALGVGADWYILLLLLLLLVLHLTMGKKINCQIENIRSKS